MPTSLTPLNGKDFTPVTDEKRLAASRCLAILVSAARLQSVLIADMTQQPNAAALSAAMSQFGYDLITLGESLDADLQALCGLLGVRVILTDPRKGAQH